ncbi:MAG: hypothetical protein MUF64_07260, partial [Polyangiaceae bacterium]|nr:hypothetical protein [Polyangiaceae bacterium]
MHRRHHASLASLVLGLLAAACGDEGAPASSTSAVLDEARALAQADLRLAERLRPSAAGFSRAVVGEARFASRGYLRPAVDTLASTAPDRSDEALHVFAGLPGRGLHLEMTPLDTPGHHGDAHEGHVVYRETATDTDTIVSADELTTEISYVLRSPRAPRTFRLRLSGDGTRRIAWEHGGSLAFLGNDLRPRLRILPPYAVDAAGVRREATLALDGEVLSVRLDTEGLRFPVLLDPTVETAAWYQLDDGEPPVRPPGRGLHQLVYDEARNRTVLFGGYGSGDTILNDTWEWDGARWSKRSPAHAPSPRNGFGMAYDVKRKVTVLFGGSLPKDESRPKDDNPMSDETWLWDGNDWTLASPAVHPPPSKLLGMAYDRQRHVTVMSTGFYLDSNNVEQVQQLAWEWDGATWKSHTIPSGLKKQQGAAAWDPKRNAVMFDGGDDTQKLSNSTLWWDGQSWSSGTPLPTPHGAHMLAADLDRSVVFHYGGFEDPPSAKVSISREWNNITWATLPIRSPAARSNGSMAYDRMRKRFVLFGGFRPGPPDFPSDETWEYDPATQHWTEVNLVPPASLGGRLAYDSKRQEVLFSGLRSTGPGGGNPFDTAGHLYEFNGKTWGRALPRTTDRSAHSNSAFAYDPLRDRAVWFGGGNEPLGHSGSTWTWDGGDWKK